MGSALAWFPLVGLALGGALAGIDAAARQGLPLIAVGALLVAALLILTRALHAEGFVDCCDGLFGGYTKDERLRILRDTHIGSFGALGAAALVLTKGSLLAGIPGDARTELLLVFPCLSRFAMTAAMGLFPYTRRQGLGASFQEDRRLWRVALGLGTAALAAGAFLGGGGLLLLVFALAVAAGLGRWISGMLGGMTGDAYGALNELGEIAVLALGVALMLNFPGLFSAPWR